MSLRARKKQQTSAAILRAAQKLFLSQGIENTRVEEIAAAVGISRAGLFNYYRGKPAIAEAMARAVEPRLVQLVEHYLARPLSLEQRLHQLFAHAARVVEQSAELNRQLFVRSSRGMDYPRLYAALTKLVEAGKTSGEISPERPTDLLSEVIYTSFVAGLLGWLRNPEQTVAEQFAARARHLAEILGGVKAGLRV